jgi:hypothetical protein
LGEIEIALEELVVSARVTRYVRHAPCLLVFPPIVRAVVAFDLMTRCGRAPEKVRWERTGSWPRYFPSSHLDDDTTRPGEELLMSRLLGCCWLIASCAVTAADGKTISASAAPAE